MLGNEFTRMLLLTPLLRIPRILLIILTAGEKVAPPSVDFAKPIAFSSLGHES